MAGKMTIRQCMDATLQLLNQYSIAGTLVPLSYNDQADTELRMINLINDAQMEIATTARPIEKFTTTVVPAVDSNTPLSEIQVEMPSDFNNCIKIYFTPASGGRLITIDANRFKWLGDDILLLPNIPAGTYQVCYNAFPTRYDSTTDTNTELDNKPDTHEIIPYYVASMIAVDENPKAYYALYNVWETRLSRLNQKPAHAVITDVTDVYGFGGGLY